MNSFDVQLWFAKDEDNNIVTINEVNKEEKHTYHCPLCNSKLNPKQGKINQWHFAHIDKSKCSNETMYHFWIKNKLLQKGDKFIVKSDVEKEYICKEILIEQTYKVGEKEYRPDLTAITESGETIYFEMNYSNEKKLEDYLDIWIELGNIVVEVDVKTLINSESGKLPIFKAKYYNGKCFNVKKGEDKTYHDTIGEYKERLIYSKEYDEKKNEIEKLDWFWKEINNYYINQDIENTFKIIESIDSKEDLNIIFEILQKHKYKKLDIVNNYYDYKQNKIYNYLLNNYNEIFQILESDYYLIKKDMKQYILESKDNDGIGNKLRCVINYSLKDNLYNDILPHINLKASKEVNRYNKYIDTIKYLKEINENLKCTFDNELCYLGYRKQIASLKEDVVKFKQDIDNINNFYEKVKNIAEETISDKFNYNVLIIDEKRVLFRIDSLNRECYLHINEQDDTIKKNIKFICTENKEKIMESKIKEYFLSKISEYGYNMKDIVCYYNGYGNIVIKVHSILYGNRLFRIKDDLKITQIDKLDIFINTTIEKVKKEMLKSNRVKEKESKKVQKRREIYDKDIKNKLKKIFDNNPNEFLEYNMNYSDYNVIYFKDKKLKEYIICLEETIEEEVRENNFINIIFLDIDNYINNTTLKKIFLGKTELNEYILGAKDENISKYSNLTDIWYFYNPKYEENEAHKTLGILNKKIINLFYKNKFKKVKKNIKYKYLYDYDFSKVIEKLNEINTMTKENEEINKQKYKSNFDVYEMHYKNKNIKYNINDIDILILNELKPIIEVANSIKNNEINIMLNPSYTVKNNKYQLWIVKDLIEELNEIGFNKFNNIINEFYI